MKPPSIARLVLVVGLTAWAAASGAGRLLSSVGEHTSSASSASSASSDRGFTFQTAHASHTTMARVRRQLSTSGVRVSPNVQLALNAMVGIWERHDDVRAAHSLADGSPDLVSLVRWSLAGQGSNEMGMVPFLGGVRELAGRLGILLDNQIAPVLYWTLANEPDFHEDVTFVLDHLRILWESDPAIPKRFATDGVVDVVGFLKYANTRATQDPATEPQRVDYFVVREAIYYLQHH